MKQDYRGFELNAKREQSLGGDDNLYYCIIRKADGYMLADSFTSGSEKPGEFMPYLRRMVDAYYEDPISEYTGSAEVYSVDEVIDELLYTFTPAEIGEHFRKYAEKAKEEGEQE